eukprot:TRINITY_DN9641_c0_g1_i12.p5 TRINITY_DN9641_c0_g1~~TRINITY_DN9641_c0_g1_i12.p5  ORF type:complete len:142 (+),score=6.25 TRINITY_DN9641_c0_g1_i12:223-648(+)
MVHMLNLQNIRFQIFVAVKQLVLVAFQQDPIKFMLYFQVVWNQCLGKCRQLGCQIFILESSLRMQGVNIFFVSSGFLLKNYQEKIKQKIGKKCNYYNYIILLGIGGVHLDDSIFYQPIKDSKVLKNFDNSECKSPSPHLVI